MISVWWKSCLCVLSLEEVRNRRFRKSKIESWIVALKQLIAIAEAEVFVDDTCWREICLEEVPLLAATFLTGFFCTVWVL